jgi:flagellar assembly protein FliH
LSNLYKNFDVKVDESFYLQEPSHHEEIISMNSDNHTSSDNLTANPYEGYMSHKKSVLIEQAKADAEKIMIDAKRECQNMRSSALEKIKMEYETAKKKGCEDGLHQGKEEALTQNSEALGELMNLIKTIDAQKGSVINHYEDEIKDLAINIVHKLIDVELEKDDTAFINIYKNVIKDFNNQEWIKIFVSDFQFELATANADLLKSMVKGAKYIEIVKQSGAPSGTCIVETTQGIVNASIDIQMNKIRDALVKAEIIL